MILFFEISNSLGTVEKGMPFWFLGRASDVES